jgi:hypothetical protein
MSFIYILTTYQLNRKVEKNRDLHSCESVFTNKDYKKNDTSTQLKCNEVKLLQSVISLYRVSHGKVYKVILI